MTIVTQAAAAPLSCLPQVRIIHFTPGNGTFNYDVRRRTMKYSLCDKKSVNDNDEVHASNEWYQFRKQIHYYSPQKK